MRNESIKTPELLGRIYCELTQRLLHIAYDSSAAHVPHVIIITAFTPRGPSDPLVTSNRNPSSTISL